jgi:hypothetical protein
VGDRSVDFDGRHAHGQRDNVWVFQIAQGLTVSTAVQVQLSGGAQSKNVFCQVAGLVDVGTTAQIEGIVLSQTSTPLHTGASINGRLFAQTAVSIDGSTVVQPSPWHETIWRREWG